MNRCILPPLHARPGVPTLVATLDPIAAVARQKAHSMATQPGDEPGNTPDETPPLQPSQQPVEPPAQPEAPEIAPDFDMPDTGPAELPEV
ncbi:hypothetical protein GCM10011614_19000 [Novosphingobium colocasiae]|uniref:Uncharacterized protein n=2 Tax=Novosphingobium colocasiae TaxID=1256513 RepID=A0A918UG89_9SPHN|nr:hypothetical protein GCM10011614_19000 [Novosphingobium colocasiae]